METGRSLDDAVNDAHGQGQPALEEELRYGHVGVYDIVGRLGEGGVGEVFLGRHRVLGRLCAIKVLHPWHRSSSTVTKRFLREARLSSRIAHPNLVNVVDAGETQAGDAYFVMEYIEGATDLGRVLKNEGPLSPGRAVHIARQVAEGVCHAHSHAVVHRDLKPSNILLYPLADGTEAVKVADFGIAKVLGNQHQQTIQTKVGVVLGTYAYMPPEQLFSRPVGPAADVYALGVVLYQMLAGRRPREARSYEEWVAAHSTGPAPPRLSTMVKLPRGAAAPLETLVTAALNSESDARPSMAEVVDRLRALQSRLRNHTAGSTTFSNATTVAITANRSTRARLPRAVPLSLLGLGVCAALAVLFGTTFRLELKEQAWTDATDPSASATDTAAAPRPSVRSRPHERRATETAAEPLPSRALDGSVDDNAQDAHGIELTLDSTPNGAMVVVSPSGLELGQTPLIYKVPSDEVETVFEFRLPGHRLSRVSWLPRHGTDVHAKLVTLSTWKRRRRRSLRASRARRRAMDFGADPTAPTFEPAAAAEREPPPIDDEALDAPAAVPDPDQDPRDVADDVADPQSPRSEDDAHDEAPIDRDESPAKRTDGRSGEPEAQ